MVFSSIPFLFYYLPVVLAVYFLTPLRFRNLFLLLANLAFYGFGEPVYVSIMLLSIGIDYVHGYLVNKHRANDKKARRFVAQSVVFNLALLLFFKYYDFIVQSLTAVFPALGGVLRPLGLPLPLGISFYTFQTMSYTIDVYRRDAPVQKNLVDFGVFVTLFPQLIAGPIVKYKTVARQLARRHICLIDFAAGVRQFTAGLCKKVLLANAVGSLWRLYQQPAALSAPAAWLGVTAFAFQLYFDFSGYSDMACGLGRMLGFRFPRNFRYPFTARSVTELWRRWHISLTSWFREYVYIPLGGNRGGRAKTIRNIAVVWLLTGIWHGAAWNFLLWGVYFGVLLVLERYVFGALLRRLPRALQHGYTLALFWLSLAFFAVEGGMAQNIAYLGALLGANGVFVSSTLMYDLRSYAPTLLLCAIGATPLALRLWSRLAPRVRHALSFVLVPAGLLLSTAYLVAGSYNPFLYFRF